MSLQTYAFIEIKSFGDLVISAASLRSLRPEDAARCRLVIGSHLQDLCRALSPVCEVDVIQVSEGSVPAIFDIKQKGLVAGIFSAFALREKLSSAAPGSTLVMESQAYRERFIVGRRQCIAIPKAENVYIAFESFIANTFTLKEPELAINIEAQSSRIALCPFSRVAAKNIPTDLVFELAQVCKSAGFQAELLLLEGEVIKKASGLYQRVIPRRFESLKSALEDYAAVISADSLPAHLAEYQGKPAFVVTPVSNTYWLPLQAFKGQHWGLIDKKNDLTQRLQYFLDAI